MKTITYKKFHHSVKYELLLDYTTLVEIYGYDIKLQYIELNDVGHLKIKKEYNWDGPSDPALDTKNFMRGSLGHDVIYQLMRLGEIPKSYRKYADELLRDTCREDGMTRFRSWWVYRAVRMFAARSGAPGSQDKAIEVLTAP